MDGIASWTGALLLISVALNFIHTVGRPLCVSIFFALVCDKRKERVEGTNANYHHHNLSFRQPTPAPLAFNWPCGSATDDDVNTCCHPQHVTDGQSSSSMNEWDVYSNARGTALHNTVQAGLLKQQNDRQHHRRIEELSRKYLIK